MYLIEGETIRVSGVFVKKMTHNSAHLILSIATNLRQSRDNHRSVRSLRYRESEAALEVLAPSRRGWSLLRTP